MIKGKTALLNFLPLLLRDLILILTIFFLTRRVLYTLISLLFIIAFSIGIGAYLKKKEAQMLDKKNYYGKLSELCLNSVSKEEKEMERNTLRAHYFNFYEQRSMEVEKEFKKRKARMNCLYGVESILNLILFAFQFTLLKEKNQTEPLKILVLLLFVFFLVSILSVGFLTPGEQCKNG